VNDQLPATQLTTLVIAALFPLTLVIYDLVSIHRVHRTTIAGIAFNLLTGLAAGALAASSWGQQIFIALE
jgi:hypothetical protein